MKYGLVAPRTSQNNEDTFAGRMGDGRNGKKETQNVTDSGTWKTVLPQRFRMPKPNKAEGMIGLDIVYPYKHLPRGAFVRGLEKRAELLSRGSSERREALLVARFYKVVGPDLRFEEGQIAGPLEDIQAALRWLRDNARYKLTEEQEAILLEGGGSSICDD